MALHIQKDENRTKLQERVAAELKEKLQARAETPDGPDGVDDSRYVENTKTTTGLAWAWILIGVIVVVSGVWLVVASTSGR